MRQLESWLAAYNKWAAVRTMAPERYIKWSGYFTLAATLRKHVFIPERLLGGYNCYPNLYVILIGDPASFKSTAMGFADKILQRLPEIPASPTEVSAAALTSCMAESPDGSIYITAGELGDIVSKSDKRMFEFLTSGYDTNKALTIRTIGRGQEVVPTPCINMIACTQPIWIANNMTQDIIGGGFASRCIWVGESKPSQYKMYYDEVDWESNADLEVKLIKDIHHIADKLRGVYDITKEAKDFMETWFALTYKQIKEKDPRIQGVFARKHVQVHKLAMLIKASQSDDLELTVDDFRAAISEFEANEADLMVTFRHIGKNEYTASLEDMKEYMRIKKRVPLSQVYKDFQAAAEPAKLPGLVQMLVLQGYIIESFEGGQAMYILNEKGPGK